MLNIFSAYGCQMTSLPKTKSTVVIPPEPIKTIKPGWYLTLDRGTDIDFHKFKKSVNNILFFNKNMLQFSIGY